MRRNRFEEGRSAETPGNGGLDLLAKLGEYRKRENGLHWEGPFSRYLDEIVAKSPQVADHSHARVYSMLTDKGTEVTEDGLTKYNFWDGKVFGLEKPLDQVGGYFHSAAERLETRKRILILMGPPGGGKSTIVAALKKGLEDYSKTDEGAVYAIKGCPMNEDPLHLIPEELRGEMENIYGVHIEGDLCPKCRQKLNEKKGNFDEVEVEEVAGKKSDGWQDITQVPVERITFSEKDRRGIGTFAPSDPKSQDISELRGSIDLSTIGEIGAESDPRAYRFDGELNVANRGIMEFIEMLKADEKFLYILLNLSQEQQIKTGRFSMIYADEVVVAHTNQAEYDSFIANKKNEALQDRMVVIRIPYNLKASDETKIYQKLFDESGVKQGKEKGEVHVAPKALETAAKFAVLTRLAPSQKSGVSLMKKLKLYDGQDVEGLKQKDVKELQEESSHEGMDGISPRYVFNRISFAAIKNGSACITPIDVLRSLKEGLDQHTSIGEEDKKRYLNLIADVRADYDDHAKTEVQKAFVYSYQDAAQTLMNNYLDNVDAYCNEAKLKDPVTDEDIEPDEKLMRSIEEAVGVTENAKEAFRGEILIRVGSLARKGQKFEYTSHDRLKEAIEKKLFGDLKDAVKITTSAKTPDKDQQERIDDVVKRLCDDHGYCTHCATELLKYVGTLLNR